MSKTRYTMVSKTGNEIYSADSFMGFIGMTILTNILSALVLVVIAAVFCGIGSLFN